MLSVVFNDIGSG